MSNPTVVLTTSKITLPANSTKAYGSNGATPGNYYQASVSISEIGGNAKISVENGWSSLNGGSWNGPTYRLTNPSSGEVTCNLKIVSIGSDTESLELFELE